MGPVAEMKMLAKKKGLEVVERSEGHFQITGGQYVVNYWPLSKKRSAHAQGSMERGRRGVSPAQAVEMAGELKKNFTPARRTPEEWKELLPRLRYAWKSDQ